MVKYFAVIGANYGDEGKGLVANKLCREAYLHDQKALNVLTNGGCQRGHTAYTKTGHRHIYSHFGSGYSYADIYFSKFYMVNPMIFMTEHRAIKNSGDLMNTVYIDENCTVSTPYDMLINRMVENRRADRHGSCGFGIWETVCRNKVAPIYWKDLFEKSKEEIKALLINLRDTYFANLLKSYDIEMTEDEKDLYYSNGLLIAYINDTIEMRDIANVVSFDFLKKYYDVIIFENAQGLLLDMDVNEWGTPTKTGLAYVKEIVGNDEIIPYYVTRSYLTKHGNGDFPGECKKEDINPTMEDKTNHPNDYQGTLRYGLFNEQRANEMFERIKKDAEGYNYKVVVTHQNEYQCEYLKDADYFSFDETDFS